MLTVSLSALCSKQLSHLILQTEETRCEYQMAPYSLYSALLLTWAHGAVETLNYVNIIDLITGSDPHLQIKL